jgi:hypothetical protein
MGRQTMMKQNCWEIMKCGREPEGSKVKDSSVCLAASDTSCDGINGGKNAGRICWAVAGTLFSGKVQGDFAKKTESCMSCKVFNLVKYEEDSDFTLLTSGQTYKISNR